jgi:hypothetical protein
MPLSEQKKIETRERLERDPDFRDVFHTEARNMYMKALEFDPALEESINNFELIIGADPGTYEFDAGEDDEIAIFEKILDAYDNQMLLDEKNASTIN